MRQEFRWMAGNSKRHVLFLDLLKKTPEASLLREFFSKPFSQGTMSIFPHHEQGFDKVKSLGKGGGSGEGKPSKEGFPSPVQAFSRSLAMRNPVPRIAAIHDMSGLASSAFARHYLRNLG